MNAADVLAMDNATWIEWQPPEWRMTLPTYRVSGSAPHTTTPEARALARDIERDLLYGD